MDDNASFDLESSKAGVGLAEKHENIFAAVGIHPHDAPLVTGEALKEIEALASQKKVVALGETGQDYFKNVSPREIVIKIYILCRKMDYLKRRSRGGF